MNVNKAIIVGRLTRDPEVRTIPNGSTVAQFSLAVSHTWKDRSGNKQESVEYINVAMWGKLGEIAGQYLIKGQECYIEGRIQTQKYTDKQGIERTSWQIVAESMQMGARPKNAANTQPGQNFTPQDNRNITPSNEEIPTINLDDDREEIRVDDIPF